jgi:hypothetical protein
MEKQKEYDVFKDSTLRFAGYANEVGEAFRPIIPKQLVLFTYGVAFVYGTADAGHKGTTTYQVSVFFLSKGNCIIHNVEVIFFYVTNVTI